VKKNSIAKRQRQADRKLTVGIDLGDRSSRYSILDEEGSMLSEGNLTTTSAGVIDTDRPSHVRIFIPV